MIQDAAALQRRSELKAKLNAKITLMRAARGASDATPGTTPAAKLFPDGSDDDDPVDDADGDAFDDTASCMSGASSVKGKKLSALDQLVGLVVSLTGVLNPKPYTLNPEP